MKRNNLFFNSLVLTCGGFLAKVFSVVYRIGLTRILGSLGIGIYQLIFPFYSLCVVLSTAGLPMAISKVISKNPNCEIGVVKKCFKYASIISISLSLILLFGGKFIAMLQNQPNITICYVILSPTIIILAFSAVIRGYFQGKHNFYPTAVSNILEQAVKMIAGLIVSLVLLRFGLIYSIIGAVASIVLSEFVSLFYLFIKFSKQKKTDCNFKTENINLFKDIMPILITNLILPVASFIDSFLVVRLLEQNFSHDSSVFLYGLESGVVSNVVSLPTIFSFAVSSVILPKISNMKSVIDKKNNLNFSLKITLLIIVPCCVVFLIMPKQILQVVYSNRLSNGEFDGLKIASKLLQISALGGIGLCVNQILSSFLQGVNLRFETVKNLTISVIVKLMIEVALLTNPNVGIYALALSNLVCYVLTCLLNTVSIIRHFKFKKEFNFALKLLFANVVFAVFLYLIVVSVQNIFAVISCSLLALCVYFGILFVEKIFTKSEIGRMKYLS
ncbi:MAG: oligosaccharide flippase family protein [Candidatus Onthoplasma sp.]